jgi:hypothetical protein
MAERLSKQLDWGELIEQALTLPGNTHGVYDRFHRYSYLNKLMLALQGVHEPVASYKGWQAVGRQVMKGQKGKMIVRPIYVKADRNDPDSEERLLRFKEVAGAFGLSQTEGDELPPAPTPGWDYYRAKDELKIKEVPYEDTDANTHGYSIERSIAVNPLATNPNKTRLHEIAHVVLGHTVEPLASDYTNHRGLYEFSAETTAFLCLTELELLDEDQASQSRAYIQGWLRGDRPSDAHIREVFKATDTILAAGYVAVESLIPLEKTVEAIPNAAV